MTQAYAGDNRESVRMQVMADGTIYRVDVDGLIRNLRRGFDVCRDAAMDAANGDAECGFDRLGEWLEDLADCVQEVP